MKNKFSVNWKSSKLPNKQRKYIANAPLHIKRKLLSINLSKELRKKYGRRNIEARKEDVVKIMRGKFKKKQGKITRIESKSLKVYIEGLQLKKREGSKADIPFQPSNLQIIELNLDDKKRLSSVERKKKEDKNEINKKTKEK
jgi:large subunit ribosomal protein L24